MTLVKEAWNSVSAATISNCWKHVDILPSSPDQQAPPTAPAPTTPTAAATDVSEVPEVVAAEQEAEAALNTFYRTDAVSSSARMSIAELLNPVQEQAAMTTIRPLEASGNVIEQDAELAQSWDGDNTDAENEDAEEDEDIVVVAPSPLKAYGMASGLIDFADAQVDPFFKDLARMLKLAKHKIKTQRQAAMVQPTINSVFLSKASLVTTS
ncbi:hypothetical protein CF326_g9772 [Tilletia indica]|nr:hypothetical protein CF326_g9772 [Tilletia indica]